MELRDIEIFLTLAEELHFGRTAERLHVSQARVSQAIKKQERQIGAALFERTSRKVSLTPIGERFHADLKVGYRHIQDAVSAATAAARGRTGTLTLGTMGALAHAIEDTIDLFRARYPGCDLLFGDLHPSDPFGPLRSGEVDLGLIWLPVHEPDFTVGPVLRRGSLLLMVGAGHLLAGRESVGMEDLGDCTAIDSAKPLPGYWLDALHPRHTPSGRPIKRGPTVSTWQECLAVIAKGEAFTLTQAEAAVYYPWPGIRYLPIRDAPTYEWALVWRTAAETPLVRAFTDVADELGPMTTEPPR